LYGIFSWGLYPSGHWRDYPPHLITLALSLLV
jgi:hypothetical protein